jgi:hypothetical protein
MHIQGMLAEPAFLEARSLDGKTLARIPLRSGLSAQSIKLNKTWGSGQVVLTL